LLHKRHGQGVEFKTTKNKINSASDRVEKLNQGPTCTDFKHSLLNYTTSKKENGVVLQCKNIASLFQALGSWDRHKREPPRTWNPLEYC